MQNLANMFHNIPFFVDSAEFIEMSDKLKVDLTKRSKTIPPQYEGTLTSTYRSFIEKYGRQMGRDRETAAISTNKRVTRSMSRKSFNVISPGGFLNAVGSMNPQFRGRAQQDSHELFHFVVDTMNEEEMKRKHLKAKLDLYHSKGNSEFDVSVIRHLVNESEGYVRGESDSAEFREVQRALMLPSRESTFIEDSLQGEMASIVQCKGCGNQFCLLEKFFDISLSLPRKGEKQKAEKAMRRAMAMAAKKKKRGNKKKTKGNAYSTLAMMESDDDNDNNNNNNNNNSKNKTSKRSKPEQDPNASWAKDGQDEREVWKLLTDKNLQKLGNKNKLMRFLQKHGSNAFLRKFDITGSPKTGPSLTELRKIYVKLRDHLESNFESKKAAKKNKKKNNKENNKDKTNNNESGKDKNEQVTETSSSGNSDSTGIAPETSEEPSTSAVTATAITESSSSPNIAATTETEESTTVTTPSLTIIEESLSSSSSIQKDEDKNEIKQKDISNHSWSIIVNKRSEDAARKLTNEMMDDDDDEFCSAMEIDSNNVILNGHLLRKLRIPESAIEESKSNGGPASIESCLKEFIKTETLHVKDGNGYECLHCAATERSNKKNCDKALRNIPELGLDQWVLPFSSEEKPVGILPQDATKRNFVMKLPNILILHLNRFATNIFTGNLQKVNSAVGFSSKLDMSPYCVESHDRCQYELIGVTVHSGGLHGGHYFCHVRNDAGKWFEISDSSVRESTEAAALRAQAFMLFYKRIVTFK
eukprot:TRINITY_DN1237_c1_g2_i4.p1 TRINITY_DN1237_c1_g2~~TRINITY_DN1237_c1_g2_i4.p1  ORF type:complete len:832 (+),score=272.54 TRINITY_DN1237_c1_g2_i4:226-2496(+)